MNRFEWIERGSWRTGWFNRQGWGPSPRGSHGRGIGGWERLSFLRRSFQRTQSQMHVHPATTRSRERRPNRAPSCPFPTPTHPRRIHRVSSLHREETPVEGPAGVRLRSSDEGLERRRWERSTLARARGMETASDRLALNAQLETLQAKYVGTGHPDVSREEWAQNIHRDSYASFLGHHHMLVYVATAENESTARVKHGMLQKMFQPCGSVEKKEERMEN